MSTETQTAAPPEAVETAEEPKPEQEAPDFKRLLDKPLGTMESFLNVPVFEQLQRVAKLLSASELVPDHFRGNMPNCFIALQLAMRWDMDPFMVMQNIYIVHGKPGLEAKLTIALMNKLGPFKGPIQWEFEGKGENRKCTAYATHRETEERCAATVTWDMVKKEGWLSKKGSKWATMPDQMFQYRTATFLARLYAPEVMMGLRTADELGDIGPKSNTTRKAPLAVASAEDILGAATAAEEKKEKAPDAEPSPALEELFLLLSENGRLKQDEIELRMRYLSNQFFGERDPTGRLLTAEDLIQEPEENINRLLEIATEAGWAVQDDTPGTDGTLFN